MPAPALPTIPPAHAGDDLSKVLNQIIQEFYLGDSHEVTLEKFTNNNLDIAKAFHAFSVREHIGHLMLQLDNTQYTIRRISSIRNSAGYTRYTVNVFDTVQNGSEDTITAAYKLFTDVWEDWVTVPIDN